MWEIGDGRIVFLDFGGSISLPTSWMVTTIGRFSALGARASSSSLHDDSRDTSRRNAKVLIWWVLSLGIRVKY
jgi:hypothetical protein